MKILVVEDNAQSRYLLEQYFAARGHAVWSAPDGRAALEFCHTRGAPDVVVSDALMPLCDGFELCDSLRRDPRYAHLPFILYTATYTAESDERFALSIGVDRFVVKPTEPDRLLEVVEEVHAAIRRAPPRAARPPSPSAEQMQEYAHMVSVKLENKLAELSQAHAALQDSETAVRKLNERLLATIARLEREVEERRRTAELLRLAQEVGGIGTWQTDGVGNVHWSAEAAHLLGLEPGAPLPQFLRGLPPEDRRRVEALLCDPRAEGRLELEVRYRPAAGPERQLLLCGGSTPNATRRLGLVQDITARHEAEARRLSLEQQLFRSQKMEALGKLAGGIAHDFNNILTAILGHAELLSLEPGITTEVRTSADLITEAGQRARGIIDQILMFSRRQSVERRPLHFSAVLESALRLVRSTIGKNVQVQCRIETDRLVLANENQIHQVLLNLCTNAAHAMRPAGGIIAINLAPLDLAPGDPPPQPSIAPGRYVRLTVRDTGCGMDANVLEHLFEPFFTTKAVGEGTGLGLAVVHGIVRAHEATISVESRISEGTTFTLLFPALAEAVANTPAPVLTAATIARGQRVLVVDDEPGVARTCTQLLQRLGHEPVVFTDPLEAREAFERDPRPFTAAVIDVLMPRLSGPDLARALWAKRPDLPVVLIAATGSPLTDVQARADGFRDLVTKPFTIARLDEALARALRPAATPAHSTPRH